MNTEGLIFLLCFFGVIAYIALRRRADRRWIENRFGAEPVSVQSFGVTAFGKSSDDGPPKPRTGFLLLFTDRLFFRSPKTGYEITIPLSRVTQVYPDHTLNGIELHQSVMKVDYKNDNGRPDAAAFRVPYPHRWIQAILRLRDRQPPSPA